MLQKKNSTTNVEVSDKPKDQCGETPIAMKVPTFAKKSGIPNNQNYDKTSDEDGPNNTKREESLHTRQRQSCHLCLVLDVK